MLWEGGQHLLGALSFLQAAPNLHNSQQSVTTQLQGLLWSWAP